MLEDFNLEDFSILQLLPTKFERVYEQSVLKKECNSCNSTLVSVCKLRLDSTTVMSSYISGLVLAYKQTLM